MNPVDLDNDTGHHVCPRPRLSDFFQHPRGFRPHRVLPYPFLSRLILRRFFPNPLSGVRMLRFFSLLALPLLLGVTACDTAKVQSAGVQADVAGTDQADSQVGDDADDATGQSDDAQPGEDAAPDVPPDVPVGPFVPAKHNLPPVLTYLKGGLLKHPQMVTVTFPGDALAADLGKFDKEVTTSDWWHEVTAGYCESSTPASCIGDGVDGGAYQLKSAPAATYADSTDGGTSDIATLLQNAVTAQELPAPATETLYMLYFPKGVSIKLSSNKTVAQSCQAFGAYHHFTTINGVKAAYAVVPRCKGHGDLDALGAATVSASHEIIEAATDPYLEVDQATSFISGGFYMGQSNPDNVSWLLVLQAGEVGDLCVDFAGDFTGKYEDHVQMGNYTVQRAWSNAAVKAGHDPCVPAYPDTYFNVAPAKGKSHQQIGVGETATFSAIAFSDAAMPDGWEVQGIDYSAYQTGSSVLSIQINGQDTYTAHNGDALTVTITANDQPSPQFGPDIGIVLSSRNANGTYHFWPIWVHVK